MKSKFSVEVIPGVGLVTAQTDDDHAAALRVQRTLSGTPLRRAARLLPGGVLREYSAWTPYNLPIMVVGM